MPDPRLSPSGQFVPPPSVTGPPGAVGFFDALGNLTGTPRIGIDGAGSEQTFKDNADNPTAQIRRSDGRTWFGDLHIGSPTGPKPLDVVYSPGNPTPGPNEYVTWAAAYAAASVPRTIIVDDTFLSPAPIPAGAWDVSAFVGRGPVFASTLDAAPGCVINGLTLLDHVNFTGSSAAPVIPLVLGQGLTLRWAVLVRQTTGAPMVATSPVASYLVLEDGSSLGDTVAPAVDVLGTCILFAGNGTFVQTLALGSSNALGFLAFQVLSPSAISVMPQGAGLFFVALLVGEAVNVAYTAATIADWNGTNPSSIADALDRIATMIGPIP